jgi:hypothetical protein
MRTDVSQVWRRGRGSQTQLYMLWQVLMAWTRMAIVACDVDEVGSLPAMHMMSRLL